MLVAQAVEIAPPPHFLRGYRKLRPPWARRRGRSSFAPFHYFKHVFDCPDECPCVGGGLLGSVGQERVVTDLRRLARHVRPVARVRGMLRNELVGSGSAVEATAVRTVELG